MVAVLGNSLGASMHVVVATIGLSALLAASAVAFTVVKLIGAAYLIALGVRALWELRTASGTTLIGLGGALALSQNELSGDRR